MMNNKIGLAVMSLFILSSCQTVDQTTNIELDGEGYHILFFSNDDSLEYEENYYDVLLDLKNNISVELENIYLIQAERQNKQLKEFNVTTYPTLIVVKDGETVVRIEGKQDKEDIKKYLNNSILD